MPIKLDDERRAIMPIIKNILKLWRGAPLLAAFAGLACAPGPVQAQTASDIIAARANDRAGGAVSEQDRELLDRYAARTHNGHAARHAAAKPASPRTARKGRKKSREILQARVRAAPHKIAEKTAVDKAVTTGDDAISPPSPASVAPRQPAGAEPFATANAVDPQDALMKARAVSSAASAE